MLTASAFAQTSAPATQASAVLVDRVRPSLVAVQFTYEGELGRRDYVATGVVVRNDGLTIVPVDFVPRQLPDEQMSGFKLVIPGDDETEIEAIFLGRDERYQLAFFIPKAPSDKHVFMPIQFTAKTVAVGEDVFSVGLLPEAAGYQAYQIQSRVAAKLRGPLPQVLVDGGGLAVVGSPVFDSAGNAIGLVNDQPERVLILNDRPVRVGDRSLLLNDPQNPFAAIDAPPRLFTPASDFMSAIQTPPTAEKPVRLPFSGLASLTGLTKDVAEFYGLKGKVAVQVGEVIPGFAADNAGLKKGFIITTLNDKPLERGDLPDESPLIFTRKLTRMSVGDVVTLGVITEAGQEPKPITLKLGERPAGANKAARYYADDLGFTTRGVVFEDTYARKLTPETPGVIVTFVRPQSAAQAAQLAGNDFVQQINQTPITSVEQFKTEYLKFRKDKPREAVVLEVLRQGNTQIIRMESPRE